MNTGQSPMDSAKLASLIGAFSAFILLLHYYFHCYPAFVEWEYTNKFVDSLMNNMQRGGLFHWVDKNGKWVAVVSLILFFMLTGSRVDGKKLNAGIVGMCTFAGAIFYISSSYAIDPNEEATTQAIRYMGSTSVGYILLALSARSCSKFLGNYFAGAYKAKKPGGFLQEERFIQTPYSLHYRGKYTYQNRTRNSFINVINPRRGVLVMGSPGSGKSWFVIEPAIRQFIEKGMALFVYDFKYPALTKYTYSIFLKNQSRYKAKGCFFCINFSDLSRTYRCNPLDPRTLHSYNDALEISKTLMQGINKTWSARQGDFFVESPIVIVAIIIWYLKNYVDGRFCTLPHAIELLQMPNEDLFTVLNACSDTQRQVSPFVQAYRNKAMEMLEGQMSSARIALNPLMSQDVYYVLTGYDIYGPINSVDYPMVFCLGGDPVRQEGLAAVLSLFVDRLNKSINAPDRSHCAIVLDEFATIRAKTVLTTVATGRSNNIVTMIAVQDINQLTNHYTHDETSQVMSTIGNLICGQVFDKTAELVSARFHDVINYRTTVSVNSRDTSISTAEQPIEAVSPATLANLSSGVFAGIVADDPDNNIELKTFHAKFIKDKADQIDMVELPQTKFVTPEILKMHSDGIKGQVEEIVKKEMKRILNDPALRQFIIKR